MKEPGQGIFLERRVYHRRRIIDAIKMLPVLAGLLFMVPALILDPDAAASTAKRLFYFLGVWALLIGLAATFGRLLGAGDDDETAPADAE